MIPQIDKSGMRLGMVEKKCSRQDESADGASQRILSSMIGNRPATRKRQRWRSFLTWHSFDWVSFSAAEMQKSVVLRLPPACVALTNGRSLSLHVDRTGQA